MARSQLETLTQAVRKLRTDKLRGVIHECFEKHDLDCTIVQMTIKTTVPNEKKLIKTQNQDEGSMNSSQSPSMLSDRMIAVFPTTSFPAQVTPPRTPSKGREICYAAITPRPSYETEMRQDADSVLRSSEPVSRTSPRSPIVLKLRRSSLFPEDEGKPTKPITFSYTPSERGGQLSSRSLAASMFLVSPLRPLARQRVATPPDVTPIVDLKTSLIDSSQAILRPLTPRLKTHRPKRSLSGALVLDDESVKSSMIDSSVFPRPSKSKHDFVTNSTVQLPSRKRWLIPAEHPYKMLWDVMTFILSFANAYATHLSIRDRQFGNSWFTTFCEAWFVMDILLNFITEYRSDNYALVDCRSVWARYLTTWFVVDVLSLFPGETLYLRPIIDQQNRRNFFTKSFFRTKAVVRVTRILRGRHFQMFGKAASHTKHVGVGASRLLQLMIKYVPKYLLFFRNMKAVVALRLLRQVHWFRKVWRNLRGIDNCDAKNMEALSLRNLRPEYDEDEDGAPF